MTLLSYMFYINSLYDEMKVVLEKTFVMFIFSKWYSTLLLIWNGIQKYCDMTPLSRDSQNRLSFLSNGSVNHPRGNEYGSNNQVNLFAMKRRCKHAFPSVDRRFSVWSVQSCYKDFSWEELSNPCGGGVEYLHRDPASCWRGRKGKSQMWDSKIW
jgi:hypothetical protein